MTNTHLPSGGAHHEALVFKGLYANPFTRFFFCRCGDGPCCLKGLEGIGVTTIDHAGIIFFNGFEKPLVIEFYPVRLKVQLDPVPCPAFVLDRIRFNSHVEIPPGEFHDPFRVFGAGRQGVR